MIRRIVPILFIFVILSHYNITTAQISKLRGVNILKIDVLSPIAFQELGFAYERVFTGDLSMQIGFQIIDEGFSVKSLKGGTKLPFTLYKKAHSCLLLNFLKHIEKILQIFLLFHFSRNILIAAQKGK